ncbi:paralemmin-1 [Tupaia chinensis]|uniref:paralemmin-1 n=1 Tax=Tupaia chinensis TaxID=246437 RepID=UPI0003C8F011|nr:paralemmin-1 [Tupaia chinensis]
MAVGEGALAPQVLTPPGAWHVEANPGSAHLAVNSVPTLPREPPRERRRRRGRGTPVGDLVCGKDGGWQAEGVDGGDPSERQRTQWSPRLSTALFPARPSAMPPSHPSHLPSLRLAPVSTPVGGQQGCDRWDRGWQPEACAHAATSELPWRAESLRRAYREPSPFALSEERCVAKLRSRGAGAEGWEDQGPARAGAPGGHGGHGESSATAAKASLQLQPLWGRRLGGERVLAAETTSQQERLQAIAEKRRRQAEIESKRRQLEDDRRQLQHLKSKALRERWLLEGTPPPASEGDEDLRKQVQEDELKARLLEGSVSRLEKEIEALENGDVVPAAVPSPARGPAPSPAREEPKAEVVVTSQQTPVATPKGEKRVPSTPVRTADGATMMKAVVHAVDGTAENGIHPLSSSEVDELIHKADEVTLSEAGSTAGAAEPRGAVEEAIRITPSRRGITGVQAQPGEATSGPPGIQPGQEPPVTMIFMGYQSVEDEAETKKVLGLQDTITAELVVIEDAAEPKEPAPPNGSAAEPPAAGSTAERLRTTDTHQPGPQGPPALHPQPHGPQDTESHLSLPSVLPRETGTGSPPVTTS